MKKNVNKGIEKTLNINIKDLSFQWHQYIKKRYSNWNNEFGKFIHDSKTDLEAIHKTVIDNNIEPQPKSGQQEFLENIINKYL